MRCRPAGVVYSPILSAIGIGPWPVGRSKRRHYRPRRWVKGICWAGPRCSEPCRQQLIEIVIGAPPNQCNGPYVTTVPTTPEDGCRWAISLRYAGQRRTHYNCWSLAGNPDPRTIAGFDVINRGRARGASPQQARHPHQNACRFHRSSPGDVDDEITPAGWNPRSPTYWFDNLLFGLRNDYRRHSATKRIVRNNVLVSS